jgi:hypothetical protein
VQGGGERSHVVMLLIKSNDESRVKWFSRLPDFASRNSASRHPEAIPNYILHEFSTMADYKMYLASSILTEDKVVRVCLGVGILKGLTSLQITYRLLSRALKVHVNVAKE